MSLPLNVSQCSLEVGWGCNYHSMYHNAGWRSGEGASWRDVTTVQCITVQAGGLVRGHHGGVSLALNILQCDLEVR